MGDFDKKDLKMLINKINNFYDLEMNEQCFIFGYYIQEIVGDPYVNEDDMKKCYELLDIPYEGNIEKQLEQLGTEKKFVVKHPGVYRVAGPAVEKFKQEHNIVVEVDSVPREKGKSIVLEFSKFLVLHRKIREVSKDLFFDGYYPQAIFEAVKLLENEIKIKSSIKDKIGVDLVNHVFSEKNPILKVVDGDEIENVDEREGFRYLLIGVFRGLKNPNSHSIQQLHDPAKTIEYLALVSVLLKTVEESRK